MFKYIHVCVHVHVHTHTYAYIHCSLQANSDLYTNKLSYLKIDAYVDKGICIHAYVDGCTGLYTFR